MENMLSVLYPELARAGFRQEHTDQLAKEAEKIQMFEEERFENEFLIWWNSLSRENKIKIDSENSGIPKEGKARTMQRKEYFRTQFFNEISLEDQERI